MQFRARMNKPSAQPTLPQHSLHVWPVAGEELLGVRRTSQFRNRDKRFDDGEAQFDVLFMRVAHEGRGEVADPR